MGLYSQHIKPLFRQFQNLFDEPAVVLLYHRVENLANDHQLLAVSPQHFDEQVAYLRSDYNLIGIDEFTAHLKERRKFAPRTVILTFDDGYADNLIHAIPVLEKHKAQALFYITTSKLNTHDVLWWDQLEYVFFKTPVLPPELSITIEHTKHTFDTAKDHEGTYHQLHPLIKYTHYKERDRIMSDLLQWAGISGINDDSYRLLSHEQLKTMSNSSACVLGSHTIDHPVLSELSYEEQLEQINGSKKILEELSGKPVNHFSYPFGSRIDYNGNSINACKASCFDMVTSNFAWQTHSYTQRFEVPRYLVRDWDLATFKSKLDSFFHS